MQYVKLSSYSVSFSPTFLYFHLNSCHSSSESLREQRSGRWNHVEEEGPFRIFWAVKIKRKRKRESKGKRGAKGWKGSFETLANQTWPVKTPSPEQWTSKLSTITLPQWHCLSLTARCSDFSPNLLRHFSRIVFYTLTYICIYLLIFS